MGGLSGSPSLYGIFTENTLPLTTVTKIGDGVTSVFNVDFVLGYISESHVKAWVTGEVDGLGDIVYRSITFDTVDMLRLSGAPPGVGTQVNFQRTVPKDALLVNFSDGDNLNEGNLDLLQLQVMHLMHEALDGRIGPIASNFDMNGYKIINHGAPVDDDDLATRGYVLANAGSGGGGGGSGDEAAAAAAGAAAGAAAAALAISNLLLTAFVGPEQIEDDAVGPAALAVGAVGNAALADNSVDARVINEADAAAIRTALGLDSLVVPVGTIIDSAQVSTTPAGYLKVRGTTIGDASSGATERANADTLPLYTILWNDYANTILPIQNSNGTAGTRGVSAASDFAAHKRMPLWDVRGYHKRVYDAGRGFDAGRVAGTVQDDDVLAHLHVVDPPSTSVSVTGTTSSDTHNHNLTADGQRHGSFGVGTTNFYSSDGNTDDGNAGPTQATSSDTHNHTVTSTGSVNIAAFNSASTGGTENRVNNIAFPCYIKY